MKYYLKKCGHQELGSIGTDGKPQRGRYLLTSMDERVLSLFPALSTAQLNDSALLPIIPLYAGKKVYCNFVYHNDKFHGSEAKHPRNEYRIYLNKDLEGGTILFKKDDIIVIRAAEIAENLENVKGEDTKNVEKIYYLDHIKCNGSALYNQLNNEIANYPISGGYGIFDGIIPEFEEKVEQLSSLGECEVKIDESVTKRVANAGGTMADLFNASSFRDFVMFGYGNLCAISGTVIRYESFMNIEAAHIRPKKHGGLFLPNNGMALCRDLHWAFDMGFFTLSDNLEVIVHPKTTSEYLKFFDGKRIRVPNDPFFIPDLANVRYHREHIFGMFLTKGRL